MSKRKNWTKKDMDYLKENYSTVDTGEMSKKLRRSRAAIRVQANSRGIFKEDSEHMTPAERTCKIIYQQAKKYGGDPESLFSDTQFVEDFVGVSCERLERGDINFDDYKGHHDDEIGLKMCCDRLFSTPSHSWDRHRKKAHS